jgi:hypothetical protein
MKVWRKGAKLRPVKLDLTLRRSVQAVAATRDYYPVHHDPDFAASSGAGGLFLNTMFPRPSPAAAPPSGSVTMPSCAASMSRCAAPTTSAAR